MIILNERFSFEKDVYQWKLHEWKEGKTKEGESKRTSSITFHTTLEQICKVILDRTAGDCKTIEELQTLLGNALKLICEKVSSLDEAVAKEN